MNAYLNCDFFFILISMSISIKPRSYWIIHNSLRGFCTKRKEVLIINHIRINIGSSPYVKVSLLPSTPLPLLVPSQSRVNLINHISSTKFCPFSTCLGHHIWNLSLFHQIRPFQRINQHARTQVYTYMAVQRPHAGIVRHVLYDQIRGNVWTTGTHQNGISTLGIVRVDDLTIPFSRPERENPEVMAVEMHGVMDGKDVLDDHADGCVVSEVIHVPAWIFGVRCVAGRLEE